MVDCLAVFLGMLYMYRIKLVLTDLAGVSEVKKHLNHCGISCSCGDPDSSVSHAILWTFDGTFEDIDVVVLNSVFGDGT